MIPTNGIITGVFLLLVFISESSSNFVSRDPNDVHFYFYPSSKNWNESREIIYNDTESLKAANLLVGQKTVFIIHGFLNNYTLTMAQSLKNAYLNSSLGYNYILVDWGRLAQPNAGETISSLAYYQVVSNVPVVGDRVAHFLNWLRKAENITDFHIVGHSLGAHVSGRAGLSSKLYYQFIVPRITGLDPAGPLFFPPITCRNIEKTDADFVDIYHTNSWVYGDSTKDGHVDFHINGGKVQPNCTETTISNKLPFIGPISDSLSCSHSFAYVLYAATLKKDYYACPCTVIMGIQSMNCKDVCKKNQVLAGYNCSTKTRGVYRLAVSNPP